MTSINMPLIHVTPLTSGNRRVVSATLDGRELKRDELNINDQRRRQQFSRELAGALGSPMLSEAIESTILSHANQVDQAILEEARLSPTNSGGLSQPSLLVAQLNDAYLFHSAEQEPYARLQVNNHPEIWPIRSRNFKQFMSRTFYQVHGTVPSAQAINDAVSVLEGKAIHDGPEHPVHTRLAEHQGRIYLDLADTEWSVVEISATGWSVIRQSPVAFRRPRGMLPLPFPQRGGSLELLTRFVNVAAEDCPLLYAWSIAAMRPQGPYPVLSLNGEQGTAKSTTSKILRCLIDPNTADLRTEPRDVHNLCIAASNSWILPFDNISYLPPWLSDAFCRLSTGGGFSTRELYSNNDETIFQVQRPVILNGIEEFGFRSDLLDRSLLITLLPISPSQRRTEKDFYQEFQQAHPYLLGALLDATVSALRHFPDVRLPEMPRMADFARWAVAAEPGLPIVRGSFMARYTQNRQNAHALALEGSPLTIAIQNFMASRQTWQGTPTDLFQQLGCQRTFQQDSHYGNATRNPHGWPSNPQKLSTQLRRLAPNLRAIGINIEHSRGQSRMISICMIPVGTIANRQATL